jgi:integrase
MQISIMARFSFKINRGRTVKNPKEPQTIYFCYRDGRNTKFDASIKNTVMVDDWDSQKEKVRERVRIINHVQINSLITNLSHHFNSFKNDNTSKGVTASYNEVREHFNQFFKKPEPKPEPEPRKPTIFEYFDIYLSKPETQRKLTHGTVKSYNLSKTFLQRFNDEERNFDFSDINMDWYNEFVEWCEGQGYSKNYIGKHIKILKRILKYAYAKGDSNNNSFLDDDFKVLREEVDNVYLDEEELKKIFELDLKAKPRHELARDLFIIGCYTGLRISDYNNLLDRNIIEVKGKKLFSVYPKKTKKSKKKVAMPMHYYIEDILKKYGGSPPPSMPEQQLNKLIKEVAEWAGIDSVEYYVKTVGGKEINVKDYKFNLIKSHTARRSFCTNAYFDDMDIIDIMSISGHSSEKTFLNYIKATPEQRAVKMSSHKFFNPKIEDIK